MKHLTVEQIEQYVQRSGDVDELLASAEHLEDCFECRDRAALIADPGAGPVPNRTRPEGGRRR